MCWSVSLFGHRKTLFELGNNYKDQIRKMSSFTDVFCASPRSRINLALIAYQPFRAQTREVPEILKNKDFMNSTIAEFDAQTLDLGSCPELVKQFFSDEILPQFKIRGRGHVFLPSHL